VPLRAAPWLRNGVEIQGVWLPKQFRDEIAPLLTPGTTLVLTDGAILPESRC
jgi:hypothetical protein